MFKKQLLFCILLLFILRLEAQIDVRYNDIEVDYSFAEIKYIFKNSTQFSNSTLFSFNHNDWKNLENNKLKISYSNFNIWLKIPVNSIDKYGQFDYINIQNPHINFLKCWIVKNDSIIKNFAITGDNVSYSSRQVHTSTFIFPLGSDDYQNCDIIIAADKRFTKLDLPIIFCNSNYLINQNNNSSLLLGLLIGTCLFLFLYNSYLFITIKQRLYLWYSVYLFLIVIYIAADSGLLYKYFTTKIESFNDLIRPIIFAFIEIPLLLFFNQLLNLKEKFPKIFLINKIFFIFYFCLIIIVMVTFDNNSFQTQGYWLNFLYFTGPIILFSMLVQSIYLVIQKVRFASFALASYSSFFIFIGIYILQQRELIGTNFLTQYANYWSILSEAILMGFLLGWRFKLYKEEAENTLKNSIYQQEQIFIKTAAWQEKEMERISFLLHDTVGANLGFLRLETDNMPLTQEGRNSIAYHITRIGNEVRNMSHSYSPIVLKDKGLFNALNDIVNTISNNSSINLQFEWIGEKNKISLQYQIIIYQIIQELLQNIIKHSKAKNAFLQILYEEYLISVYVEDDGIGFDVNEEKNGIGLKNISTLVSILNGTCRIESKKLEGFNISIEFINHINEKK